MSENRIRLDRLKAGDTFEYMSNLYLRTNEVSDETIICVDLITGEISWFAEEALVYRRETRFTVK